MEEELQGRLEIEVVAPWLQLGQGRRGMDGGGGLAVGDVLVVLRRRGAPGRRCCHLQVLVVGGVR